MAHRDRNLLLKEDCGATRAPLLVATSLAEESVRCVSERHDRYDRAHRRRERARQGALRPLVHVLSARSGAPSSHNCAAIPENLLERSCSAQKKGGLHRAVARSGNSRWRTTARCFWTRSALPCAAGEDPGLGEKRFQRSEHGRCRRCAPGRGDEPRVARGSGRRAESRGFVLWLSVFPSTVPPLRDRPSTPAADR